MTCLRRWYRAILRDFMAGRVLPIIASQHPDATRGEIGRWSYDTADVMLEARDRPPVTPRAVPSCSLPEDAWRP